MQTGKAKKIAVKLLRQFIYPTSSQLITLLKDCSIEDKEFI